ncbi:universal stress protein [Paenibacillus senegalensis]|uniref:universal stress protein n=1 Tax=Paenibacillus senegalensis TaxID=1465766 RepID=UPI00028A1512|nr:universal stress protein [Paenibacillus senegalensis]
MYRKILVAIDGSHHSLKACEHTLELAERFPGATVYLLHVIGIREGLEGEVSTELLDEMMAIMKPFLKLGREKGITCETLFLHGEAGPIIIEHAEQNSFDLIVMGSRGLGSLKELVLGSVSQKVIKHVRCPVMIVK